jgi:hypothetical protein
MINSINSIFSTCSIYRIGESEFGSEGNFFDSIYLIVQAMCIKGLSYVKLNKGIVCYIKTKQGVNSVR